VISGRCRFGAFCGTDPLATAPDEPFELRILTRLTPR
jgi:hypothetical protein